MWLPQSSLVKTPQPLTGENITYTIELSYFIQFAVLCLTLAFLSWRDKWPCLNSAQAVDKQHPLSLMSCWFPAWHCQENPANSCAPNQIYMVHFAVLWHYVFGCCFKTYVVTFSWCKCWQQGKCSWLTTSNESICFTRSGTVPKIGKQLPKKVLDFNFICPM